MSLEMSPQASDVGFDRITRRCWESESIKVTTPSDVNGQFSVAHAWFGHENGGNVCDGADVTEKVRSLMGAESCTVIQANAQNLGLNADTVRQSPGLQMLHIECRFQWLSEREQEALKSLAEESRTQLDFERKVEDRKAFEDLSAWWVDHLPAVSSASSSTPAAEKRTEDGESASLYTLCQLGALGSDCLGRAALKGLRYLTSCRCKDAVAMGLSSEEFGFPLCRVALQAARMVLAFLHLLNSGERGLSSVIFRRAPRVVIQRVARRCCDTTNRALGSLVDALCADLMVKIHSLWQSGRSDTCGVVDIVQVMQQAQDSALEELATQALGVPTSLQDFGSLYELKTLSQMEPVYMHAESFTAAVQFSFCPICFRPLQQFPEDVGAVVDVNGNRFESALYHRRCVASREPLLHGLGILSSITSSFAAPDLPSLLSKESQAKSWWPLPGLTSTQAWAKFVRSPFPNTAAIPCNAVAAVLAASLPVHIAHIELAISRKFGVMHSISTEDLPAVAVWALETQCELADICWCRPPAQLLLVEDSLDDWANRDKWASWFRGWDYHGTGSLTRGELAFALSSTIREVADLHVHEVTVPSFRKGLTDCTKLIWPGSMGIHDPCDFIGLGRFLREIAPGSSACLQCLVVRSEEKNAASMERSASPRPVGVGPDAVPSDDDFRRQRSPSDRQRADTVDTDAGTECASGGELIQMCSAKILWLSGENRLVSLQLDRPLSDLCTILDLLSLDSLGTLCCPTEETQELCKRRLFVAGRKLEKPELTFYDAGITGDCTILTYCKQLPVRLTTSQAISHRSLPSTLGMQPLLWAGAVAILGISFCATSARSQN